MTHQERLKTLESGMPLPEVEIANAEARRTQAHAVCGSLIMCGIFTVVGPVAVCGIAVATTTVLLEKADAALHPVLISTVWLAAMLISIAIIVGNCVLGRHPLTAETLRSCATGDRLQHDQESSIQGE